MGIFSSKKFRRTPEMPPNMQPIIPSSSQNQEDNNLVKMRRQLYNDAPTFILNNLLLSIQFFNNYEKDIADLRISNVSRKENKINTQLSKQQKHCLIPDTLHELIDTNVCFQPRHGASKYYTESLHTQRILVAYDNIEVHNPSETVEYSSALDGPIYKCVIEGTELKGYVQLKLKEIEVKRKMSDRTNSEQLTERKDIINVEETSEVLNKPKVIKLDGTNANADNHDEVFLPSNSFTTQETTNLVRQLSLSSMQQMTQQPKLDKFQESEYTYKTITDHYTTKPLKQIKIDTTDCGSSSPIVTTKLPSACITSVQIKVYRDKIEEEEEKRKLRDEYPDLNDFRRQMMVRKKRELYRKVAYVNSIAFSDYFGDTFPQYIGGILGFTLKNMQLAMMQDATIYIDVMDTKTKHVINYEVIPSLISSWPDEAYEWSLRTRPVIQDERTQTAYRWPTPGMINRVKSLPNHIYPIGFHPKRGENPNRDLQWRLQFPAAERFLESHLHHAQIRCYLLILTFYKSFIESKDIKLGLTADHIRTHLFWECERDYVRWPENRLGEKLIVFLKNLRRRLEYQELPDYFIPSRNLFENIPTGRLMIAHRKIADILENPVMYTIKALRNLKYRKKSFYPVLNYNKLYKILTADNIIELINPQIPVVITNPKFVENDEVNDGNASSDDESMDPVQRWYRDAYRKRQEEKEAKKKKEERVRRTSCDSINSEIKPVRTMDIMRQMLILKLFISHFIEMARTSNVFDNPQQGLMYLQQAKNLNTLLNEMASGQEDAIEYFALILQVEELLKISLANEEALPKIPERVHLHNHHINRITRPEITVSAPKIYTTSSNYVNVDQTSVKERSNLSPKSANRNVIVDESEQKLLDDRNKHPSSQKDKNQNEYQEENSNDIIVEHMDRILNNNKTIKESSKNSAEYNHIKNLKNSEQNTDFLRNFKTSSTLCNETTVNDKTNITQNISLDMNTAVQNSHEKLVTVQVDVHSSESKQNEIILNKQKTVHFGSKNKRDLNENVKDDTRNNYVTINTTKATEEKIKLNEENAVCINFKLNGHLNESSPDDEIIIQNDFDENIAIRTNTHIRSNVNSIILRENSEEIECTDL